MAATAATQGLSALNVTGLGLGTAAAMGEAVYSGQPAQMGIEAFPWNPVEEAQKELARFLGQSASELAKRKRGLTVMSLDPDIAQMRSISLSHKISMQRDRLFARTQEEERSWLEKCLDRAMNPREKSTRDYL